MKKKGPDIGLERETGSLKRCMIFEANVGMHAEQRCDYLVTISYESIKWKKLNSDISTVSTN